MLQVYSHQLFDITLDLIFVESLFTVTMLEFHYYEVINFEQYKNEPADHEATSMFCSPFALYDSR